MRPVQVFDWIKIEAFERSRETEVGKGNGESMALSYMT